MYLRWFPKLLKLFLDLWLILVLAWALIEYLTQKFKFWNKKSNGPNLYSFQRPFFSDQNGAKFLKIGQKLTEIWPSKVFHLEEVWPFPHGKFNIKWPKLELCKNPLIDNKLYLWNIPCYDLRSLSQKLHLLLAKKQRKNTKVQLSQYQNLTQKGLLKTYLLQQYSIFSYGDFRTASIRHFTLIFGPDFW